MGISFGFIFRSIQEVIVHPKAFWKKQEQDSPGRLKLLQAYLLPLVFIASISVFTGEFFRSNHFYAGFALMTAGREFFLFFFQYFLSVFFTNELIKTFGGEKNIRIARQLVACSLTPFLLVSVITGLFPFLYVLDALGLYSFYIFALGAKQLIDFPEKKTEKFILITILVNFFVFSFLSVLLSKLLNAYL